MHLFVKFVSVRGSQEIVHSYFCTSLRLSAGQEVQGGAIRPIHQKPPP